MQLISKDKSFLGALSLMMEAHSKRETFSISHRFFEYEDYQINLALERVAKDTSAEGDALLYSCFLSCPNVDPELDCAVECFGFEEMEMHLNAFLLTTLRFLGLSDLPAIAEDERKKEPQRQDYFSFRKCKELQDFLAGNDRPFTTLDIASVTGRSRNHCHAWIHREIKAGKIKLHSKNAESSPRLHSFVVVRGDENA